MWSFAADSAAAHLCRGYDAALGYFPQSCLANSGIPALAITAIALLAAAICARMAFGSSR